MEPLLVLNLEFILVVYIRFLFTHSLHGCWFAGRLAIEMENKVKATVSMCDTRPHAIVVVVIFLNLTIWQLRKNLHQVHPLAVYDWPSHLLQCRICHNARRVSPLRRLPRGRRICRLLLPCEARFFHLELFSTGINSLVMLSLKLRRAFCESSVP